jgi:uncharacterized protein (TIRG00374 family)
LKKLIYRVIGGVVAGIVVYVGFTIWADAQKVGQAMASFFYPAAAIGFGLALLNYLFRFIRWHYYLRQLRLDVSVPDSALVFLAGFSLTVTPGKLGEAVKAFLLKQSHGIPAARTAPIVVAERLTDLIGLLLLAGVGAFTFDVDTRFLAAGAALVGIALVIIMVESLAKLTMGVFGKLPVVRRFSDKMHEAYESAKIMLKPGPLIVAVVLSTLSWAFECAAFWVIVKGFVGADVGLQAATFIYATMTIAGALSFLPGGLGVTEAGMLTMLSKFGTGINPGIAAASTFVTRVATLWFAVVLGVVALLVFSRRRHVALDMPNDSTT